MSQSAIPAPARVKCPTHGTVYLSTRQLAEQRKYGDAPWTCPKCGQEASFDDVYFEEMGLQ